jgi:hypothetical protein
VPFAVGVVYGAGLMASIDVTTRELWNIKEPALGLLAATCTARAAAHGLTPEERAPFEALSTTVLSWWPRRKRAPDEIDGTEFAACVAAFEADERLRLAMDAAYQQMAALLRLDPRSMSRPGFYNLGEDQFVALVRRVAKAEHTDLELWKSRFEALLEAKSTPWPELVARAGRMGFGRDLSQVRNLPEPLQALARFSTLGAVHSWSMMGPKHALKLEVGSTKRIAMLDDAQRAELVEAMPWLG